MNVIGEQYTLGYATIVRREYFGCLVGNAPLHYVGQFNHDTYEILRRLTAPQTIAELQASLLADGLEIDSDALVCFLLEHATHGSVVATGWPQKSYVFNQDGAVFRNDCLSAPWSTTLYTTDWCPKTCRHCVTRSSPHVSSCR